MPFFHPPLTPPVKGGEFKRMPFIPALPGGAFWHVFVKAKIFVGKFLHTRSQSVEKA